MVRQHHQLNGHEFEHSGRWRKTEEPGALQSMGSQRVRYDWATEQQLYIYIYLFIYLFTYFYFFHPAAILAQSSLKAQELEFWNLLCLRHSLLISLEKGFQPTLLSFVDEEPQRQRGQGLAWSYRNLLTTFL